MDKENYIKERLEDQISWYDAKSQINQWRFKWLSFAEIFCATLIPFVVCLSEYIFYGRIVIGSLGVIIAVCAGLSRINKYQENWLMYRTTCETLRHEKYLFLTGSSPYNGEDRFNKFVERVENIISKENSQWSSFTNEKSHNKK